MDQQFFQVEKSRDDIRRTVLTNIIKMLTERKTLNKDNMDKNINLLLKEKLDEETYNIPEKNNIIVKFIDQKITSINKQSAISEFVGSNKDKKLIIIVKDINLNSIRYIKNISENAEVFKEVELMINIVDHVFVPKYDVLDRNSNDYINFKTIYSCTKKGMPKLLDTDPLARYYGLKVDDIVRIIRPSESSGQSAYYRLVIKG